MPCCTANCEKAADGLIADNDSFFQSCIGFKYSNGVPQGSAFSAWAVAFFSNSYNSC